MNVLVVDDDEMILSLARRMLERGGHHVATAANGTAALQLVESQTEEIAVAIIDMSMKGMSGLETLAALRHRRPSMPAIISTGYAPDEAELPAELATNTRFLHKPYGSADLLAAVDRALAEAVPAQ